MIAGAAHVGAVLATKEIGVIELPSLREVPAVASPATTVTPASARFYRPELDVLRFFAFLSVFLHHMMPRQASGYAQFVHSAWLRDVLTAVANAGGFGLCLFFMLSAYLITELLQRETAKTGTVHITSFYKRRILRIWPLYFGALLLGMMLMHFLNPAAARLPRLLAYAFFAGNWYCSKHGWSPDPSTPLWSVSIEEQFYLVWPWVMKFSRKLPYALAFATLIGSAITLLHLAATHQNLDHAVWSNSFVQFSMFAPGVLAALFLHSRTPSFGLVVRAAMISSGLTCWVAATYVCGIKDTVAKASSATHLLGGYFLVSFGTLLLLLGFLGIKIWIPKFLIELGKISYGLYVYHLFAAMFVDFFLSYVVFEDTLLSRLAVPAVTLLFTMAFARVSYDRFEVIFLRAKEKASVVVSRPI